MTTRVLRVSAEQPDAAAIEEAAAVLQRGGLVAFPTETVYGLGGHALDPAAVGAIFRAKGRPATDPVIVHLAGAWLLPTVARDVPPLAQALADRFWPGPLTLILHKQPVVPDAVTAGLPTVGVRVPSHPVARRLLERAALPIAAPSANRFSRPSPTLAAHVLEDLDGAIDLVLDAGPATIGVESTIVDLTVDPPLLRRPGGVAVDALRAMVPSLAASAAAYDAGHAQPAPGQLLRHYAPRAPLTLYRGPSAAVTPRIGEAARAAAAAGSIVGILAPSDDLLALAPRLAAAAATGRIRSARYGSRGDVDAAARELFQALRTLDAAGVDVIYASVPEEGGVADALIDRLTRAAEGRVIHL
jgi:L-threonylcarbamoyladenylate synthase